jgi:hypothetical protein
MTTIMQDTTNGKSESPEGRTLKTIGPIAGADHGDMTWRAFEDDIDTDGHPGALSWLATQVKPKAGQSICRPLFIGVICTSDFGHFAGVL